MRRAANAVRGWVELELTGDAPEEFFNLCARQNLGFWAVKKCDGGRWTCRTSFWTWPKLRSLAGRGSWTLKLLRRGGLPGLFWRLRYRWALLVGLAVCLSAVGIMSRFVLTVRVSGNQSVPTGTILSQLRARGVKPGAFGPGLDVRQIGHEVLLELPQLSWMSINVRGTVCEVLVREGTPRPELVEEDESAHIVAKYPGIVTRIDVTRGEQMVQRGQTVAAGDTLIGSWVDFKEPEYYQGDMGGMLVRAAGRVRARTWHTLKAAIPLTGDAKVYTGREDSRWSAEIFGHSVKFPQRGSISYGRYDKIITYYTAPLGLPIALRRETCREYETESRPVDPDRAADALKGELQERLDALCDPSEVKRVDYKTETQDGLLVVTLLAECEQDIGMIVEE